MKRMRNRYTLIVGLVLFVFLIMLATTVLIGVTTLTLIRLNIFPWESRPQFPPAILIMLLMSTVIGTTLAALFGNRTLQPIRDLISATREIANGNFAVRVDLTGPGEIQDLGQSFNKMAQELAGIETLRKDFINNFSHEFKTPIVSIRGFAKLLKKDTLSPELRDEYIDIIMSESERLTSLATNVLVLSKLDNQGIITEKSSFLLDEQLRRVILLLEPQWQKKGLDLQLELDPVQYTGNEELLQQVWMNLIGNAIKFTPAGGKITVVVMDTDSTVTVRITDNGIGMDDYTKQHLFDRFFQGDRSHTGEGNGLGLALVKRIVELSSGTITVKSQRGYGSSFSVELPISP